MNAKQRKEKKSREAWKRIHERAEAESERARDPVREPVVHVWNGYFWQTERGHLNVWTRYLSIYRLNESWRVPRDVQPIPLLDIDGEVRDGYQVAIGEDEVRGTSS